MSKLGCAYERDQKCIAHDAHEKEDVVAHRTEWLLEERALEIKQYLWVQMPFAQAPPQVTSLLKADATFMQREKDELYHNVHLYNEDMVEFYVDMLDPSEHLELSPHYGHQSVRYRTGRMLKKQGMDECAYNSHNGNDSHWIFDGKRKLLKALKSRGGAGIMGAFRKDEFYGMGGIHLTDVQLDGHHAWRKKYCTQTETEAHRNPLAVWFEYGKKAEGDKRPDYWGCD